MGDSLFLNAISGQDPYGYAAMKSLPLRDENISPPPSSEVESSPSSSEGLADGADMELAGALLKQCSSIIESECCGAVHMLATQILDEGILCS